MAIDWSWLNKALPYRDNVGVTLINEVTRRRPRLVLGWVTFRGYTALMAEPSKAYPEFPSLGAMPGSVVSTIHTCRRTYTVRA